MPCYSEHMRPSAREQESVAVRELLRETRAEPFDHDTPHDAPYGVPAQLDEDVAALCAWCAAHSHALPRMSLDLQVWWRKHQRQDQERQERTAGTPEPSTLRRQALAKLTPAEIAALDLSAEPTDR